jgi:PAS domain S-box-containing protein
MVLEKLLDTVMRTAMEHAGAERALLMLSRGAEQRVAAEATTKGDTVFVHLCDEPATGSVLPQTVLEYVLHTRESVILDDAAIVNPFSSDPYIRQRRARSVLCLPVSNQARLIGVLYLENNLAPGVFAPARITVLKLLAAQAAISLDNTRLYRDLGERERELRLLVDTIPALMWRGTSDGELDYLNGRAVEYIGDTAEGLSGGRWLQLVHPDHRDAVVRRWLHSVTTGSSYDDSYKLRRADGQYRWIQSVGEPLRDGEGEIVRWYGAVNDIDDLKRTEEALREREREARLIVDSVPGLVATMTPAGVLEAVNAQLLAYMGRTVEELRQWATNDTIHPEDLGRVSHTGMFTQPMTSSDPFEIEERLRRFDGIYRWFQARALPLRGSDERIVRWYVLLTDIDDLKRAEAELTALKDQLYRENLVLRDEVDRTSMFEEIVGTSPALQPVLARVAKVARSDSTVLITGETGTGKELVARAIHRRSARASRAFVSVNCAAVPRDLIASELFGHEKGAFTGATQRRLGRFELAHGGTIFLDEVGDLPVETQVALLRVLQEREFDRVGGSAPVHVDVRVIAATNRDLQAAIESGTFRSDLYYRLNVFPIPVPALRERPEDISLLVEYFIDRYARQGGKTIRRVNKRMLDALRAYPWPGNVRELQNVIERSVIVCDTDEFTVDESWLTTGSMPTRNAALSSSLAAHEKTVIEEALRASGGRVFGPSGAAARLGIARSTLESKIQVLGIDKNRFRGRRPPNR